MCIYETIYINTGDAHGLGTVLVCNICKAKSMLCDIQDWFYSQLAGGEAN